MWLRDSGAQVWPYVQLANQDPELKKMLEGVIRRQFMCINIDPYANAYNDGPVGGSWMSDLTDMKPELHERKWEIDSLCYPLRLAYQYWKETGDASVFDQAWIEAITNILKTFKEQQRKDVNSNASLNQRHEKRHQKENREGKHDKHMNQALMREKAYAHMKTLHLLHVFLTTVLPVQEQPEVLKVFPDLLRHLSNSSSAREASSQVCIACSWRVRSSSISLESSIAFW